MAPATEVAKARVNLLSSYQFREVQNTYATVEAVGGEDQVHTLYGLFFESSTDASGKFIELHDISPEGDSYYESGQTVELDLPTSSAVDKSKAYNILLIANPTYYIPTGTEWNSYFSGITENEVVQLRMDIEASSSDSDYSFTPFHQDALPMSGSIQKEAGEELITAELTRVVCRFDIINSAGDDYQLVSASVGNAFPQQTVWESGNYSDFTLERIPRLYGIPVFGKEVKGGLYAYENFVVQTAQDDDVTTCLILGIKKVSTGVTSYYRVNASQSGNIQQLKRNHVYTFNIKNVKGNGNGSESVVVGGSFEGGAVTYYPVDILEDDLSKILQATRNYKYVVYISKVNSGGYPDPDTASEAEEIVIISRIFLFVWKIFILLLRKYQIIYHLIGISRCW